MNFSRLDTMSIDTLLLKLHKNEQNNQTPGRTNHDWLSD